MPIGGFATCSSTAWPATVSVPPIGTMREGDEGAGSSTRYGASLKTNRSASAGTRSSLKISLMPSASVWRRPKGPQRWGPMRLCMSEIALRSNQIITMTALIKQREGRRDLDHARSTISDRPRARRGRRAGRPREPVHSRLQSHLGDRVAARRATVARRRRRRRRAIRTRPRRRRARTRRRSADGQADRAARPAHRDHVAVGDTEPVEVEVVAAQQGRSRPAGARAPASPAPRPRRRRGADSASTRQRVGVGQGDVDARRRAEVAKRRRRRATRRSDGAGGATAPA